MTRASRITQLIGFAIVTLTIAIAATGFFVVRKDIDAMSEAAQENILWSAVQIEIELMRFQQALVEFHIGAETASPDEVNRRFDILWSRVSVFRQGTVGERLSLYDSREATVALLFAKMREVEPQVVGLSAASGDTARALNATFLPFADDLRRLSQAVLHGEADKNAALREDLSNSSSALAAISAITMLTSLLLIVLFSRESNRFRQLAEENQKLLETSRSANKAKSQFLAMMSHELRTPMNGVLGLLALVRQHSLTGQQARLMEQAERSGTQMIDLLKDILDFSALQDDQLKLDKKPFETRRLVEAVSDMFEPVALREGIVFEAVADDSCPDRVIGDFARLRQALTHLAAYLLETAGTSNITLDLSYDAGHLIAAISFDYSKVGGEWDPVLIMGKFERTTDSFASEALGPAVSRGLIERMGGTTKLFNPTPDRIAVLVTVPAEELVVDILSIRIVSQSMALEAICKAALRGENVRFVDKDSPIEPHVVMIEAGGEQEPITLRACAARFPQAMLVALGRPQDPEEFDDIVEVPIDIVNVRQAEFMRLATSTTKLAVEPNLRYAD